MPKVVFVLVCGFALSVLGHAQSDGSCVDPNPMPTFRSCTRSYPSCHKIIQVWSAPLSAQGFLAIMGTVDCCGIPLPSLTGFGDPCGIAELRNREVRNHLASASKRTRIMVATCRQTLCTVPRMKMGEFCDQGSLIAQS